MHEMQQIHVCNIGLDVSANICTNVCTNISINRGINIGINIYMNIVELTYDVSIWVFWKLRTFAEKLICGCARNHVKIIACSPLQMGV